MGTVCERLKEARLLTGPCWTVPDGAVPAEACVAASRVGKCQSLERSFFQVSAHNACGVSSTFC